MIHDPHALTIHIDGSALNNPGGPGGIAAIAVFPERLNRPDETIFAEGFAASTNNRMELMACIKALQGAPVNAVAFEAARVVIVTDSTYVSECHKQLPFWRKNHWRNKDGRPVENVDLWKDLITVRAKIHIPTSIEWQRGKSSDIQRGVDKEAKLSAQEIPAIQDRGYRPGKIARTKLPGMVAEIFRATGQQEIIRIYRKGGEYHSGQQNCKIYFEVYSEAEGKYVSKNFAYTSPEIESALHRSHLYMVQFNTDPRYPVIESVLEEVMIT